MAGREMLFGEGPTACPFVALEDDRDRRSDEPDPRHRCYAEPEPAPRALAHQRSYCLSPGFAGCPIFQDWAVRAAARPIAPAGDERPPDRGTAWAAATRDTGSSAPTGEPAWTGPPPWAGRDDVAASEPEQIAAFDLDEVPARRPSGVDDDDEPSARSARPLAPPLPAAGPASAAASGDARPLQAIERLPSLPPEPSGDPERDARIEAEHRRRVEAERQRRQEQERRRRAEQEQRERERAAASAASVPPFLAGRIDAAKAAPAAQPGRAAPPPVSQPVPVSQPASSAGQAAAQAAGPAARRQARREDLVPIWERDPIQAYPTLRRRISLSSSGDTIGTLTTIFAVLAIVALAVFALIAAPSFLGGGGPRQSSPPLAGSPSAPATAVAASPTSTPAPQRTPRTYTIKAGDSLFAIGLQFGLTVDQLLAANPQITDPNIITIGQVIVIPEPDDFPASPAGATTRP